MTTPIRLLAIALIACCFFGCTSNNEMPDDLGKEVGEAAKRAGKGIKDAANDMGDLMQDTCDKATEGGC